MKGRKPRIFLVVIFAVIIFATALLATVAGETITVPDDYSTIQAAISAASPGDIVYVCSGTYYENVTISKSLTVIGEDPEITIIDGGGTGQVITASGSWTAPGPSFTLEGLTITNGLSGGSFDQQGAGINCYYSGPGVIRNCRIIDNSSTWFGGGIFIYNLGRHNITDFRIENCLIANNYAGSYGGGIACYTKSSPSIINCTIVDNSAWYDVEDDVWVFHNSYPIIRNSIIGTLKIDLSSSPTPGNITFNDILSGPYIEGNISVDPRFADPEAGDYHLQPSSPCVDVGDNVSVPSWLTTDFEDDPRKVDGDYDGNEVVDMGADEYYGILATINIDPDTLNLKRMGKWITAYLELPEGYDVIDIDFDTVRLQYNGTEEALWGDVQDNVFMAKFDGEEVKKLLNGVTGIVELKVTGKVDDTPFGGSDTIRVK
jgi:hypothetical protein